MVGSTKREYMRKGTSQGVIIIPKITSRYTIPVTNRSLFFTFIIVNLIYCFKIIRLKKVLKSFFLFLFFFLLFLLSSGKKIKINCIGAEERKKAEK
jgi:hypothetical protein